MRRVFHSALLAAIVAAAVTAVSAAQTFNTNKQVTLIMKGGERHIGTLVYHNDNNFNLIENGQEKPYAISDVAVVDFGAGDPTAAEVSQLPRSGSPTELRRHMLVLRDGSVIHGKMYTIKENAITIDPQGAGAGGRRDVDLNNVARLYVDAAASRQIYASLVNNAANAGVSGTTGTAVPAGAIQVNGNQAWTDSGVTVAKGQRIAFSASGTIQIRPGTDAGPQGLESESRAGVPVPAAAVGALIGRVGTGAPFPIGSGTAQIAMPANGRLYLGINDGGLGDNSGAFVVTIVR